jgi:hypothetical protein
VYCCAADDVLPTGECGCRGVENDLGGRGKEEGGERHGENPAAEPCRYQCDAEASESMVSPLCSDGRSRTRPREGERRSREWVWAQWALRMEMEMRIVPDARQRGVGGLVRRRR